MASKLTFTYRSLLAKGNPLLFHVDRYCMENVIGKVLQQFG